ncbi:deoxyribodipyrimidine photo-lyase [Heliobacterium chlorum]|uniref:Deoxyribodipyrimidine photo-lyase n=1 Tax=Heliobacterium chlorum TaxID=2698 RepID=A0ABR7T4D8_HELCL|nr:deoxyribodipyrimidine photo-lyase [Heliobacterium chlorum]MBC9785643.1 deoxyribodipyrimidine photo-lyase [Heliobacterium chlorum]
MIQNTRIQNLNDAEIQSGEYVLYWMQASQRTEYNHALEYAIDRANRLDQPLLVYFGITDSFPGANERHYGFMLEGLQEVQSSLRQRGIAMIAQQISPEIGVVQLASKASLVVVDRGYLRIQKEWRQFAASRIACPLVQVEADVIVPVETASPKEEYAAATFRPKIKRQLQEYLVPLERRTIGKARPDLAETCLFSDRVDLEDIEGTLARLNIDRSVGRLKCWQGGTSTAKRLLERFITTKLEHYGERRNDPSLDYVSSLSPYLHFGQISPLYMAFRVQESNITASVDAYMEELIVRRELSINFVHYNLRYDEFTALPEWARQTLHTHRVDCREFNYGLSELENGLTDDPFFNAAQTELRKRGIIHGYMRMYWGKKILEWSPSPEEAFQIALCLNDKYALDGRDPNGYTGVAWCFGKHDRPWGERAIFGKVRYMNAAGLRRKFNAMAYVQKVEKL